MTFYDQCAELFFKGNEAVAVSRSTGLPLSTVRAYRASWVVGGERPLETRRCESCKELFSTARIALICDECRPADIGSKSMRYQPAVYKRIGTEGGTSTCGYCSRAMQGDTCYKCGWTPKKGVDNGGL